MGALTEPEKHAHYRAMEAADLAGEDPPVWTCRSCGCDDLHACCVDPDGGACDWVERDLCTACAGAA